MIFNSQSVCGAKFTEKSTFYRVQNSLELTEISFLERQSVEKRSNDKIKVSCDVTGRFYTRPACVAYRWQCLMQNDRILRILRKSWRLHVELLCLYYFVSLDISARTRILIGRLSNEHTNFLFFSN